MMPGVLVLASLGYAALLFAIAWFGDRHPLYRQRPWLRPAVYGLALAVYCSSWTFYGAVGSAVRHGIGYVTIYLGPLLLLIFGWRLLERLAQVAQNQSTVSIADFIASRFGRSQRLGALVAVIALVAAVPYLALQYKAVATSVVILGGPDMVSGALVDPALYVALLMALFSIMFGTRQVDATEHRPGLMLAVAFESVVKLVALVAVGVMAMSWFRTQPTSLLQATHSLLTSAPPIGFVGQTLLSFMALICLPRQFHVAVVECGHVGDIRHARWMFGGYLIVVSLMVLPIASAGVALFGRTSDVAPDSFMLALPLALDQSALAIMAYIGGFSAATGMVIVSSVALATLVSNDLVMPLLLRRKRWAGASEGDLASQVLWVRRLAILALAGLAYGYYRSAGNDTALAAFGLMAFAAVAQFAPALIGGLYWRGASRQGVEAGLLVGFLIWAYTLLLPSLAEAGWFGRNWIDHGPFHLDWLRPHHLFGLSGWDPLTQGTFWSLLANIVTLLVVSARWRPGLGESLSAEPFLDPEAALPKDTPATWSGALHVVELQALASRVLGARTAQRAFSAQARSLGLTLDNGLRADPSWIRFTELLLAGAVGAASARVVLASALKGSGMDVAAVLAVLDAAGHELRFNRDILVSTLAHIEQGVSVVDADMRLVAWNPRYQTLLDYPGDLLYVGRPVADLIRYNAERGRLGAGGLAPDEIEHEIAKRIDHMRAGTPHQYQRTLSTGRVIDLRGRPLPGGGYVTSYSDVTDYKHVERELRDINETLEQRVADRTREAELAQTSRLRFLTAVSHDVLQPINAARLFASALREASQEEEPSRLAERVDTSLRAAEELLEGLLDISRLDAGVLRPSVGEVDVAALLRQLVEQYGPMAAARGLRLRCHARPMVVRSDPRLLRRVLQNFLANALRYTRSGGVVLAARARGDTVALQVWDSGPGIPPHHLRQIYDEFHRYEQPFDWDGRGLGLGLSICQRISRLLGHTLDTRSRVGHGSMFSVIVPRVANPAPIPVPARTAALTPPDARLVGLRVLCVDNDPDILEGMRSLLPRWGCEVLCASTVDEALQLAAEHQPDALLVDYHLHDRLDGLETLDALRQQRPDALGALLTADGSDALKQAAKAKGYHFITKPVRPAVLRALLAAPRRRGETPTP